MDPDDRAENAAPENQEAQTPKVDTAKIYPTATLGVGADILQPDQVTNTKPLLTRKVQPWKL